MSMDDGHDDDGGAGEPGFRETPPEERKYLDGVEARSLKLAAQLDPELSKVVGFTFFDTASSEDNRITVLTQREDIQRLASQTLVRIKSQEDKREYLGLVVRGPFFEPDALSSHSTMLVNVVIQGKKQTYTFDYHGRAEVEILGEETPDGVVAPRHRPRPKSPVFLLGEQESEEILGLRGTFVLGRVMGYERMEARIDAMDKALLPRHTGIIGTTGGGKSTTVATLIHRAQLAGIATVVLDVEGEYTRIDEPTDDARMLEALRRRGQRAEGVQQLHLLHLVNRETRNPDHPRRRQFGLRFSQLSPYAIAEILEMSPAQQERFLLAYDVTKLLLQDFRLLSSSDLEQAELYDELSTGHPKVTLQQLLDVVQAYLSCSTREGRSGGAGAGHPLQLHSEFRQNPEQVLRRVRAQENRNEVSWRSLGSKLKRLHRLKLFDVSGCDAPDYRGMLEPGRVSVVDLSDTDSPQLNNLVIAEILRGVHEAQDAQYHRSQAAGEPLTPVLIIIEEAHEFLSATRIQQMPALFEHVARIAKRGRKRWLGLVFVTQLPQHLPNEVLGLLNHFILHKVTDSAVIDRMRRTVGGVDPALWDRLPRLAPGQAVCSFSSFTRPLLIEVDPAPVKRLLVE